MHGDALVVHSFFFRGNNTARLAECYFMTENYAALEKMIVRRVPDTDPLLSSIAEMFASVGLCDQAVEAYTKRGQYVLCGVVTRDLFSCCRICFWLR